MRLEPLDRRHAAGLLAVADPELFRFLFDTPCPWDLQGFEEYVDRVPGLPARLPFAIIARETDTAVGMTAYFDIRPEHRGLEIGHTWLGRKWQRTGMNREAKLLLLDHAFGELGCVRVQLKTDATNTQSRRAIESLGATFEGILRRHMIRPDGFVRDTAMYAITDQDWPAVREALARRSGSPRSG